MTTEELAVAFTEVDSRSRSNTHRLDRLEERQDNLDQLVSCVAGMQKDLEHTQGDVKEIKGDVKAMMETPRKNWNTVITAIITSVVGALVGALLALVLG